MQQLLEYQRFREAAADLGERRVLGRDVFAAAGEPEPTADPGDPVPPGAGREPGGPARRAARRPLAADARRPPTSCQRAGLSVAECVERILARFALGTEVEFAEVFSPDAGRGEVIVTFLALLELIRLKVIRAVQHDRFGPIQLELAVGDLAEARERAREMSEVGMWRGVEVSDGSGPGDRA